MDGSAEYKKEVWWWIEWKVFLCAWLSVRGKWGEKVGFQSGCTISTIVDKEFFHRPASTPPPSSWSTGAQNCPAIAKALASLNAPQITRWKNTLRFSSYIFWFSSSFFVWPKPSPQPYRECIEDTCCRDRRTVKRWRSFFSHYCTVLL